MATVAAKRPTVRNHDSYRSWIETRKRYLCASESAAVLGCSPHSSPYGLWCRKTGMAPDDDGVQPLWLKCGHALEPVVAGEVTTPDGVVVHDPGQWALFCRDDLRMACTPDRLFVADGEVVGNLQIKTANWRESDWDNGVPLHIEVQVQHEMLILGVEWSIVAVMFKQQAVRTFDLKANHQFQDMLIKACRQFWRWIEEGTAPVVDSHKDTTATLRRQYPDDSGEQVTLGDDLEASHRRRVKAAKNAKRWQQVVTEESNRLRLAIGEASQGVLPSGTVYTNKKTSRGCRVLRCAGEVEL